MAADRAHPIIIMCLIGGERAGKDTTADYLVSKYGFTKYSIASPLKNVAKELLGFTTEQLEDNNKDIIDAELGIKPRDFLIWLGSDICRHQLHEKFPNLNIKPGMLWANKLYRWITNKINIDVSNRQETKIVIPDVRFMSELNVLNKFNGINILKIYKTGCNFDKYEIPQILESLNRTVAPYNIYNNTTLDTLYTAIDDIINIINSHDTVINEQDIPDICDAHDIHMHNKWGDIEDEQSIQDNWDRKRSQWYNFKAAFC